MTTATLPAVALPPFYFVEVEAAIARDEWLEQLGLLDEMSTDIDFKAKSITLQQRLDEIEELWLSGQISDEDYQAQAWPVARELWYGQEEANHALR